MIRSGGVNPIHIVHPLVVGAHCGQPGPSGCWSTQMGPTTLQASSRRTLMFFGRRPIFADEVMAGLLMREPDVRRRTECLVRRLLPTKIDHIESENSEDDRSRNSHHESTHRSASCRQF